MVKRPCLASELTLIYKGFPRDARQIDQAQLAGIWAAPEAAGAGAAALAGAAGAATLAASNTLPLLAGRRLPKYAKAKVAVKNTVASTAVVRDKKLALPLAPNKLPEPPLPKAAPISAPFPCWIRINPIIEIAEIICTVRMIVTK